MVLRFEVELVDTKLFKTVAKNKPFGASKNISLVKPNKGNGLESFIKSVRSQKLIHNVYISTQILYPLNIWTDYPPDKYEPGVYLVKPETRVQG